MIPTSTYVLIFGIPAFVVVFCTALSIIGKKIFPSDDKKEGKE